MKEFVMNKTSPIVETTKGKLRGFRFDGVDHFYGIRYAKAKRSQMPEPVPAWEGVKDAGSYGMNCPVLSEPMPTGEVLIPHRFWPSSEHCQYLNLWTKSCEPSAKRPVLFWIHGGGYASGSGMEQICYDGFNLAKDDDVVVVTVNHRLNAFGYLDLSAFGEKYWNSVNVGMADLVEALRCCRGRDKHKAEAALRDYAQLLILPFGEYSPEMANWKWGKTVVPVWNAREDAKLEIWYPHGEVPFECAVVSGSLRPALIYYRQRILDAGMVMRTCNQCGRVFFAPDARSNLCSERCRKASKRAARKSFDRKSKEAEYEQAYKREYMFWYNRVKKLEKNHVSREQLEKAQSALKQFRKEAGQRKKQIQNGELSTVQFMNWMIGQEAIIQEICGG